MKKVQHPGLVLRVHLEQMGIPQNVFAKHIGVTNRNLNEVVRCRRSITPDMALRLELALSLPATSWLDLQRDFDLHQARCDNAKSHKAITSFFGRLVEEDT